jgi:hypothetical protein
MEGNMLFAIAGDRLNGDRENISGQYGTQYLIFEKEGPWTET